MVCCKIITNYNNKAADYNKLLLKLSSCGMFLWKDGSLYFSNIDDINFSEKDVRKIFKQCHYTDMFINVYDRDNPPQENDDINAWLFDKIIKINYKMCEIESQAAFREISVGLDALNEEIKLIKLQEEQADGSTEQK